MRNTSYKLILNDLTEAESVTPFNKGFEEYKKVAFLFLNHTGKHLFAEDILSRYREGAILEGIFEQENDRFIPGANHKKGDKMERTWYDVWSMDEIEQMDEFFDFFFACKLRHLSLLEIGDFLNFHFDYSFKNNRAEFQAFLNLSLSQYHETLLTPHIIEVINEWIKTDKPTDNPEDLNGSEKEEKIKGRIPREAGDHLTTLNLNQTAMLIQFMQQTGIILKGDYLTYTQAGKAFNILTGYSAHTIRQQLGTKGEIEGVKFEDYKELHEAITRIANLIEPKIHKK